LAISVAQSKRGSGALQPKPAASAKSPEKREASTISFLWTQPRMTQVPPTRNSSATITFAP
jgi:hypothetical protein